MKERELESFLHSYFKKKGLEVNTQVQINHLFRADLIIFKDSKPFCLFEIKSDPLTNKKIYTALGQLDIYLELLESIKGVLVIVEPANNDFLSLLKIVERICKRKGFAFLTVNKKMNIRIIVNSFITDLIDK